MIVGGAISWVLSGLKSVSVMEKWSVAVPSKRTLNVSPGLLVVNYFVHYMGFCASFRCVG